MKKIISCILTVSMLLGMLAIGGVITAAEPDMALEFDDLPLKEGGGDKGMGNLNADLEEKLWDKDGNGYADGFTVAMDFTMGRQGPCFHPIDATLYHSSKFNICIGASEGTNKYFGYNATKDVFYFATSANGPFNGETVDGYTYLAVSETGLVKPGVTYDLVFELVGSEPYDYEEVYINIYLDGQKVLSYDLYSGKDVEYFNYEYIMLYPTHINCYIDNLATYKVGDYNPATGEGKDNTYSFTDFSEAKLNQNEDGTSSVSANGWGFATEAYGLAVVEDEIYGQPTVDAAEGQTNVIFENGVQSTSGKDFEVPVTIANNYGINSIEMELMHDPLITVKEVVAAEGLTAKVDGNKVTLTGNNYTGDALMTVTYTMDTAGVQNFFYGYGARASSLKITGNEKCADAVLSNGISKLYNYTKDDVNDDGKYNLTDVSCMLQMLAKWDVPYFAEAADVNDDGRFNGMDASYYLKWIAGWPTFEIGGITRY